MLLHCFYTGIYMTQPAKRIKIGKFVDDTEEIHRHFNYKLEALATAQFQYLQRTCTRNLGLADHGNSLELCASATLTAIKSICISNTRKLKGSARWKFTTGAGFEIIIYSCQSDIQKKSSAVKFSPTVPTPAPYLS